MEESISVLENEGGITKESTTTTNVSTITQLYLPVAEGREDRLAELRERSERKHNLDGIRARNIVRNGQDHSDPGLNVNIVVVDDQEIEKLKQGVQNQLSASWTAEYADEDYYKKYDHAKKNVNFSSVDPLDSPALDNILEKLSSSQTTAYYTNDEDLQDYYNRRSIDLNKLSANLKKKNPKTLQSAKKYRENYLSSLNTKNFFTSLDSNGLSPNANFQPFSNKAYAYVKIRSDEALSNKEWEDLLSIPVYANDVKLKSFYTSDAAMFMRRGYCVTAVYELAQNFPAFDHDRLPYSVKPSVVLEELEDNVSELFTNRLPKSFKVVKSKISRVSNKENHANLDFFKYWIAHLPESISEITQKQYEKFRSRKKNKNLKARKK